MIHQTDYNTGQRGEMHCSGVWMGCNQNTKAYPYSKGIQDEGAKGIEGGRRGEIEHNKQAHIKLVSFFFSSPPLPPSLCLSLSLTITAALEAELLNCSKMSELQSSLE